MDNHGIGIRLRMLSNSIRRYIDRSTDAETGSDNITCTNGWIIAHLIEAEAENRSVYQSDLENEFGITRSTASKVLILLEKKGVIRRLTLSHDARKKVLALTDKGREIGQLMRANAERVETALTEGFSPEELSVLNGYLDRILENIQKADGAEASAQTKE